MTSKLLHKEFRLSADAGVFLFPLFGAFLLIPAFPYSLIFLYGFYAIYDSFRLWRENNDIYYTALLPVSKRDIVSAKFLFTVIVQLVTILISIPFAFLRVLIMPEAGNLVGIEANIAFYGFGLMIFAFFNIIFLSQFFKTAHKTGKPFLLSLIPMGIIMLVMEVLVHVPGFEWLDSVANSDMLKQIPLLVIGVVAYVAGILIAYKVSAKQFEKVDL